MLFAPSKKRGLILYKKESVLLSLLRNNYIFSFTLLQTYQIVIHQNRKKIASFFKKDFQVVVMDYKKDKEQLLKYMHQSRVLKHPKYPMTEREIQNAFSFYFFNNPKAHFNSKRVNL